MDARLTVSEAALELSVTPGRVRQMITNGQLPAERFGNQWAIDAATARSTAAQTRVAGRPWSTERALHFLRSADRGQISIGELDIAAPRLRNGLENAGDSLAAQWLRERIADPQSGRETMWRLLRRYRGAWPIADLAAQHVDRHDVNWTMLRMWADHLRQHPDVRVPSIADEPVRTGSARFDNLFAGMAEHEAAIADVAPPAWIHRIERLAEPWRSSGTPMMQDRSNRQAPVEFAARNIWLAADNIWSDKGSSTWE